MTRCLALKNAHHQTLPWILCIRDKNGLLPCSCNPHINEFIVQPGAAGPFIPEQNGVDSRPLDSVDGCCIARSNDFLQLGCQPNRFPASRLLKSDPIAPSLLIPFLDSGLSFGPTEHFFVASCSGR